MKVVSSAMASCSVGELREIQNQLERSLRNIRLRKDQIFKEQIQQLKENARLLSEENARLSGKCGEKPWEPPAAQKEVAATSSQSSQSSEALACPKCAAHSNRWIDDDCS